MGRRRRDSAPPPPRPAPFNPALAGGLQAIKTQLAEHERAQQEQRAAQRARPPTPQHQPAAPGDEAALWEQAIGGVAPLDGREARHRPAQRDPPRPGLVDQDQEVLDELQALVAGELPFTFEQRDDFCAGYSDGLDRRTFALLCAGELPWSDHLDLHGLAREEAHARLSRWLLEARRAGRRCVLVVTGRGRGSPDKVSVLRQSLPAWVSRGVAGKVVLAFCTAQPRDGGPGAFYVLLRRSGTRPFIPLEREDDDDGQR